MRGIDQQDAFAGKSQSDHVAGRRKGDAAHAAGKGDLVFLGLGRGVIQIEVGFIIGFQAKSAGGDRQGGSIGRKLGDPREVAVIAQRTAALALDDGRLPQRQRLVGAGGQQVATIGCDGHCHHFAGSHGELGAWLERIGVPGSKRLIPTGADERFTGEGDGRNHVGVTGERAAQERVTSTFQTLIV